jgi:hypothetical protein
MIDIGIGVLKGKVLTKIIGDKDSYELIFITNEGEIFKMYHVRDCCESVFIEDICGELSWLIGSPILIAEERCSDENPPNNHDFSFTWTFYELSTFQGAVTIRWYGESNGYYSESVDFERI